MPELASGTNPHCQAQLSRAGKNATVLGQFIELPKEAENTGFSANPARLPASHRPALQSFR